MSNTKTNKYNINEKWIFVLLGQWQSWPSYTPYSTGLILNYFKIYDG